ncbi:allophanate hydrolase subunit 1 [Mycolicibacterium sp. S2-37]|uniref:5-oxoprolinase subunit B family protein n=1 Tax=Mycolicibacterium sp. S2-37 TaxID=2810297 RepID=UPI001A94B580|nr:allophanate hydrolase subunit 1 [Mycolicibacterium sp. S2-37]MBO0679084.1 allophanate hydrolase subunit 1 [Mycolicibacterium sp. S2-37]
MTSRVDVAPALRPCGEHAWLLDLDDNRTVHRWAATIRLAELPGVREVVPGLTTLLVTFDPDVTNASALRAALGTLQPCSEQSSHRDHHVIDVRYDGEDLDEVSELTGLTVAEVIAAHTESVWSVAFCGFAPGFSYLVGGDPRLYVPRRDEARVRVPAGAVAIAGEFSAVYPRVSPGGWQLLGHTDAVLWDSDADPPAVLRPGAVVRFRRVGR